MATGLPTGVSIYGITSNNGAEVDADNNLKVEIRAPAIGSNGAYQAVLISGSITAPLAQCSTLFSMRWTSSSLLCLVKRMRVSAVNNDGSTTTSSSPWSLQAYIARSFTASDSGGTAVSFSGNQLKLRTSMASSAMGDMRILNTSGLTVGTRTLDAFPIAAITGASALNIASGVQFFNANQNGYATLFDRTAMGIYPFVLAQNEGIVLQTPLLCAGPAAGTFLFSVEIEWEEVSAY